MKSIAVICLVIILSFLPKEANATNGVAYGRALQCGSSFMPIKKLLKEKKYDEVVTFLKKTAAEHQHLSDKKSVLIASGSKMLVVDCLYRAKRYEQALKEAHKAIKSPEFKEPSRFKSEMFSLMVKNYENLGEKRKAKEYKKLYDELRSIIRRQRTSSSSSRSTKDSLARDQ